MKRKLKKQSGFTLAETLLAVLILLLVSGIVAEGVPVAKNVYEKVFIGANAQALLSTTAARLRDELGTAWDVSVGADKKTISFYSADTGAKAKIYLSTTDTNNPIRITEYKNEELLGQINAEIDQALISKAASENTGLRVEYSEVSYNAGIVTFKGLKVYRKDDNTQPIATMDNGDSTLTIRVIGAQPTPTSSVSPAGV